MNFIILFIAAYIFVTLLSCVQYRQRNIKTLFWNKEPSVNRAVYYRGQTKTGESVNVYCDELLIEFDEPIYDIMVYDYSLKNSKSKEVLKEALSTSESIVYGVEFIEYTTIKKITFKNSDGYKAKVLISGNGREGLITEVIKWNITVEAFIRAMNPVELLKLLK